MERRVDIQLVVLKNTESISELEFIQRLTLNCKKCMLCFVFLSEHLVMNVVQSIPEPLPYAHRSCTDKGQCDRIWISSVYFGVSRLKGLGFLIICWKQNCHHQITMLTLTNILFSIVPKFSFKSKSVRASVWFGLC